MAALAQLATLPFAEGRSRAQDEINRLAPDAANEDKAIALEYLEHDPADGEAGRWSTTPSRTGWCCRRHSRPMTARR